MAYETIEASGQTVNLDDGETYENKLIDLTTGGHFTINCRRSSNVTIRNIGFRGLFTGRGFLIGVGDTGGGVTTIENVYMADGGTKDGTDFVHGVGGIFVGPEHRGTIEIRDVNVQGFPNNGIYGSAPGGSGSVEIANCFGKNNGVTTYRLARGSVRDSVAYNDGTDYGDGWSYGNYGGWGETDGRPFWIWSPGNVNLERLQLRDGPYAWAGVAGANGNSANVTIRNSEIDGDVREADGSSVTYDNVGSNPDLSVPEGVPTSAEQAANGEGSSGNGNGNGNGDEDEGYGPGPYGGEHYEYEYRIENVGDGDVRYNFEAAGEVTYHDGEGDVWNDGRPEVIAGVVPEGEYHILYHDGLIQDVDVVEGDAEGYYSGEPSALGRYPLDSADESWKDDVDFGDGDPDPPDGDREELLEEIDALESAVDDLNETIDDRESRIGELEAALEDVGDEADEGEGVVSRIRARVSDALGGE